MTLYDAIRALKFVQNDDRIVGLIADMSSTNAPSVNNDIPLGLAQIEELQNGLIELKNVKESRLGPGKFRTVAFTETFRSQGEYTMASGFDEIYCQPTGEIPLVGINSTVTFYSRLLNWLGIKVHAEARTHYKSMVAPYTQEEFSDPQAENHLELLQDLNTQMLTMIAMNRFGSELPAEPEESDYKNLTDRVLGYAKRGPLTVKEAVELGLITGTMYKEELLTNVILGADPIVLDETNQEVHGKEKQDALKEVLKANTKTFYHYHKIMDELSTHKGEDSILNVGVVYVLGTIGDMGEFGTSAIIKGLHEAAEDDSIGAVVLRIDSGGGGVVESDTIWGAVKALKAKGKVVIASFGNAAASGGYLIATHADSILASQTTITGSIGVASLRPTITTSFFDRLKLKIQSFFTGSNALSIYHELEGEQLARHKTHIDQAYQDFKDRVCEGRQVSPDLIEVLAGGRVYTGQSMWELNETMKESSTSEPETLAKGTNDLSAHEISPQVVAADVKAEQPQLTAHSNDSHALSESSPSMDDGIESAQPLVDLASSPEKLIIQQSGTVGTLGRGIIDGIGGIREAAIVGAETYLNRLIQQTREQHPEKTQEEIMDEVLPGVPYVANEDGEAALSFDIRLKKFPVHKSFWQQLNEASKRDGLDATAGTIFSLVKASFGNWVASTVLHQMESELSHSLQLKPSEMNDFKRLTQLIRRHNQGRSVQAEMAPWNFQ